MPFVPLQRVYVPLTFGLPFWYKWWYGPDPFGNRAYKQNRLANPGSIQRNWCHRPAVNCEGNIKRANGKQNKQFALLEIDRAGEYTGDVFLTVLFLNKLWLVQKTGEPGKNWTEVNLYRGKPVPRYVGNTSSSAICEKSGCASARSGNHAYVRTKCLPWSEHLYLISTYVLMFLIMLRFFLRLCFLAHFASRKFMRPLGFSCVLFSGCTYIYNQLHQHTQCLFCLCVLSRYIMYVKTVY